MALVAVCLTASAAGCALVGRMGYDWLPSLALRRVDNYLSLNTGQREIAQRRLGDLHAWHRSTQLDDYAGLLREVQRAVAAGPVDEARLRAWRLEALELWRPIAERAAPGIAEVALALEPPQLERMRAEIRRDNDKLRRERMPPDREDRVEARYKRYLERAETFLGSLTAEQKALARRFAAEAPDTEDAWFAQRLSRQQELVALFERIRTERPTQEVAERWLRRHLMRYAQPLDGPAREGTEASLAAGDAMGAAMLASASPRQRQHLQRKLQEWIDLLESLGTAGTTASADASTTVR